MPMRALHPCGRQGCGNLTYARYCSADQRLQEQQRGTSTERGYDSKWRRARAQWLQAHPWCATCEAKGQRTLATMVDHIIPHRGNLKLMWGRKNWQSLDDTCHAVKRQRESMVARK